MMLVHLLTARGGRTRIETKRVLTAFAVGALATALVTGPAAAGGPGDPLLGDIDGDGRTDRATLVDLDAECGVDIALGQAGGGFGPATRHTWPDPSEVGYCPDLGVIVDLGGDGAAELVLAYFNGRTPGVESDLIVLEDFTPAGGFDAIFQPSFIGLESLTPTEHLVDVYEWTDQGDGIVTWLNTASGQLVRGPVHQAATEINFDFADFDRNGATDLVTGFLGAYPAVPDAAAVVILDDGQRVTLRDDGSYYDVDALDASGDGKRDVRLDNLDSPGEVAHFIGDGRGAFTEAPNAVDDTVQVPYRAQKTISVLVNDAATTAATLEIVTPPAYGTIVRTTSKGFVYRNTVKHHNLVYRLTVDGKSETATATLRVR